MTEAIQWPSCRKCGKSLQLEPLWQPTWNWHMKTLGIIYAIVLVLFFVLKGLLKPYVRHLPPEVTPWLHGRNSSDGVKQ